jgi:O-antigen/teichoic acid export membrane protein
LDLNSLRRNFLPLSATLLLFIGVILILAGFVVLFLGQPDLGGRNDPLYDIVIGIGSLCVLLGAWISRRWYNGQKSRIG